MLHFDNDRIGRRYPIAPVEREQERRRSEVIEPNPVRSIDLKRTDIFRPMCALVTPEIESEANTVHDEFAARRAFRSRVRRKLNAETLGDAFADRDVHVKPQHRGEFGGTEQEFEPLQRNLLL